MLIVLLFALGLWYNVISCHDVGWHVITYEKYGIIWYHIILVIFCHVLSYYVILYCIILHYIISYYIIISCYIVWHYIILYYIILYHITLHYIILYYIILHYIISYYIILHYIIWHYIKLFTCGVTQALRAASFRAHVGLSTILQPMFRKSAASLRINSMVRTYVLSSFSLSVAFVVLSYPCFPLIMVQFMCLTRLSFLSVSCNFLTLTHLAQ